MAFADTARLVVDLDLDNSGFSRGMKQTQTQLKGVNTQVAKTGKQLSLMGRMKGAAGGNGIVGSLLMGAGIGGGMMAITAGIGALKSGISVIQSATAAAQDEDAAIQQLTRSMEANAEQWDGNIDRVEQRIALNQRLRFGDAEQRAALQNIVSITKDEAEAFEVLGVAMDFARLKGISLRTSAELMQKVAGGQTSMLTRYGIVLKKNATATEALAQVQEMAAGQAESYAESDRGYADAAKIAWGDAMESLGRLFTGVTGDVNQLSEAIALGLDAALTGLRADIDNIAIAWRDVSTWATRAWDSMTPDIDFDVGDIPGMDLGGDILNRFKYGPAAAGLSFAGDVISDNYDDLAYALGIKQEETDRAIAQGYNGLIDTAKAGSAALATAVTDGAVEAMEDAEPPDFSVFGSAVNPEDMMRGMEEDLQKAINQVDKWLANPRLLAKPLARIRQLYRNLGRRLPEAIDQGGAAGGLIATFIADTGADIKSKQGQLADKFDTLGVKSRNGFLTGAKLGPKALAKIVPTSEWQAMAFTDGALVGTEWSKGFASTAQATAYPAFNPGPQGHMPANPYRPQVSARDTKGKGNKVLVNGRWVMP